MSNFRKVNDDILKDWLLFREDELSSLTCEEDRKHQVYFDEISKKILNSIPKQNRAYVQKQLNVLDDNFLDYLGYWNEKYYRNGFVDGSQIAMGCFNYQPKGGRNSHLSFYCKYVIKISINYFCKLRLIEKVRYNIILLF